MFIYIVCPHCHATNRVPSDRLMASPKCGSCHQALFVAQPVELNERSFNRHISNSSIPLLVDFWAPWCGPCRIMAPALARAAHTLEPTIRLIKVNTEDEPALAAQYNIRNIPTLVLFKDGKEIARQSGVMSEQDLVSWIQPIIRKDR